MADNEILKAKINDYEWNKVKISSAATRPNQKSSYGSGISAQGTKEIFNAPSELIKERHNKLVEGLAYIGEEERARQSAETERQKGYTEMKSLIGDIDAALTSILKTQSALIGGNSNDI